MTNRITEPGWHGWHLHPDVPALTYHGPEHPGYQIDLDRMLTCDDLVFWFIQISRKPWPQALAGFAEAVDDVLQPHQRMSALRQVDIREKRDERAYTSGEVRERVRAFVADLADEQERDRRHAIAEANFR